jgi:hypothetical protein
VKYRLRRVEPPFVYDVFAGDWASPPFDTLEEAAQAFIEERGVGKVRVLRDIDGHPRNLLYEELRRVNEIVYGAVDREVAAVKARRAA